MSSSLATIFDIEEDESFEYTKNGMIYLFHFDREASLLRSTVVEGGDKTYLATFDY